MPCYRQLTFGTSIFAYLYLLRTSLYSHIRPGAKDGPPGKFVFKPSQYRDK